MREEAVELSPEMEAIVAEEEACLARVRASLAKAHDAASRRAEDGDLRSVEALRALRDDARSASEDDLPALMLEMSVRQRLRERAPDPLPDLRAPYLAHLRVREENGRGGAVTKDYLLGHASFFDAAAGVRVVDWRVAPVARIFYGAREGDAYEEAFPGRVAEGTVVARRIVVIEEGELTQILGDGVVLTRQGGTWRASDRAAMALAAGGAGSAARADGVLGVGVGQRDRSGAPEVTALLDAEQFAAITAPPEQPLLVLGTAGSGKTTVALHRLARLAAADPARHPLARASVIVPEEGLARLSRRLLAPLGVGEAQVRTLDAWSLALARHVFGKVPPLCTDPPALVTSLKRHPALYHALRARFAKLKPESATLKGLRRRMANLLTDRTFLGEVVAASNGTLPRSAIEETVRHTMQQLDGSLKAQLALVTDAAMKVAVDGRSIAEGTPDAIAGTVDVDDLPIFLFIRAWRGGLDAPAFAHLVLDEAEDFSLFDLFVLGKLLGDRPSVTLAGDEAQQTSSSFAGWDASLAALGVSNASTCRLAVSYRCPQPVVDVARRILGGLAPEQAARAARDGAPVGMHRFPDENLAKLFVADAVRDLAAREPRASIAIIARSPEAARELHALLSTGTDARLVLSGEFSFEPGIDVTDADNAKGLEFDYVVVPDASADAYPATDDARRRLHVAVTRTSHQLWLVAGPAWSPLLEGARAEAAPSSRAAARGDRAAPVSGPTP